MPAALGGSEGTIATIKKGILRAGCLLSVCHRIDAVLADINPINPHMNAYRPCPGMSDPLGPQVIALPSANLLGMVVPQ